MLPYFQADLANIDWSCLKSTLAADSFDNGRTPAQLQRSFEQSQLVCIARADSADGPIIGTARALSDGICNAYVVDVWTASPYRRRGIARAMIRSLLQNLQGQHVSLFTDDHPDFYERIGFTRRGTTFEQVVGKWLVNESGRL